MPHLSNIPKAAVKILLCAALGAASMLAAPGAAAARTAPRSGARHHSRVSCGHAQRRTAAGGCEPSGHRRRSRTQRVRPAASPRNRHTKIAPPAAQPATPTSTPTPANAAATIASVLAAPCANTELLPEPGDLPAVRGAVLCLINRERAQNGIAPLKANAQLEEAAEGHCSELIQDDYFAHVSPSGETPVDRIRDTGYIPSPDDGYVIGENLAWGTYELSTPKAIVAAWIASPEHLANILEAQYVETGIGVTPAVPSSLADGAPGGSYAEEFGVIIQ